MTATSAAREQRVMARVGASVSLASVPSVVPSSPIRSAAPCAIAATLVGRAARSTDRCRVSVLVSQGDL
jgi:hypothetical protein